MAMQVIRSKSSRLAINNTVDNAVLPQTNAEVAREVVEYNNIWMPWTEPLWCSPLPDAGDILVIIPSSGMHNERLKKSISCIRASAKEVKIRVLVICCPVLITEEVGADDIIHLAAPFNFCRSVNAGLMAIKETDGYVLILNDDCFFTQPDALRLLKDTLREKHWACVGPWIDCPETQGKPRAQGPRRTNECIWGTAALWTTAWVQRIGLMDEDFGKGWGGDEYDYSLRALRLGAVYGRNDLVIAEHESHGTFGEAGGIGSQANNENMTRFREKWGFDLIDSIVHKSVMWWPMPGIHVCITGHNVGPWLARCLATVEKALDGYRWILTVADDASTDNSFEIAKSHHSNADRYLCHRFTKAKNAAEAKNRALYLGKQWAEHYPALVLMDADDEMTEDRIRYMLWQTRDRGLAFTYGDLIIQNPDQVPPNIYDHGVVYKAMPDRQVLGGISPTTAIIHHSLVPADGKLFNEEFNAFEDCITFLEMYAKGVRAVPISGKVVHVYHRRAGSVTSAPATRNDKPRVEKYRKELLASIGIETDEPV